ncbi:hypothetical protein IC229_24120 [Spirosoma sp. BT702]|uniref:Uncharacterized protein n=1 Tax=Spirosoma profusum TaxID=2771354 RepID=A0A927APB0_9BACT|nr:hypothetical protein [Spirosoma profusum]MBD2703754.1 hypothetical protein [Spirosoma profusum]
MQPNLTHLHESTPPWLEAEFVLTTFVTLYFLYVAVGRVSKRKATSLLIICMCWLTFLIWLAYQHFFQQLAGFPPHFLLAIGPPFGLIIGVLIIPKSRAWIRGLPLSTLTLVHVVRVPVELTLYSLFLYQQIPELMTFAGRNFDVLSGLTAPVMAWLVFRQKSISLRWLLLWNVVALGLVLNIVIHAILSAPFPFQQLAFGQPNVGVLKAPYVWLPGFIVPVVLFSHVVSLLQLISVLRRSRLSVASV